MNVRFTNSYVDRLFAKRDLLGIYHLVSIVAEERSLAEEFWLFSRLLEWEGATRCGIWQYYEGIAEDTFQWVSRDLDQFGLSELAEQYRFGQRVWRVPEQVAALDRWIDAHTQDIYAILFSSDCPSPSFPARPGLTTRSSEQRLAFTSFPGGTLDSASLCR